MQVTIFGACHILAMSSACTNPVLYGFLNQNMKDVSTFVMIYFDIISYFTGFNVMEITENVIYLITRYIGPPTAFITGIAE